MSHFAKIENNTVTTVIVAEQDYIDTLEGTWVKTSYNTRGGVHYGEDGQPDNGVALRANYACIGFTYDEINDVFYSPKPYPSWTISAPTWTWTAPVAPPSDASEKLYLWNETNKTWNSTI